MSTMIGTFFFSEPIFTSITTSPSVSSTEAEPLSPRFCNVASLSLRRAWRDTHLLTSFNKASARLSVGMSVSDLPARPRSSFNAEAPAIVTSTPARMFCESFIKAISTSLLSVPLAFYATDSFARFHISNHQLRTRLVRLTESRTS